MLTLLTSLAFLALLGVAAHRDYWTRRIPNLLTVSGFCAALVLRSFAGGEAAVAGLLGAALAFGLALPLLALGGFGGGDAKLLVAVGAFLGPRGLLLAAVLTALAGAALALRESLRFGAFGALLRNTGLLVVSLATLGRHGRRQTLATPGALAVPYGLAIAAGSLIAWLATGPLP